MTMLLAQIFLLMLGAFLAGASLACLFRRAIWNSRRAEVAESALVVPAAAPVAKPDVTPEIKGEAARFGRALAGGGQAVVPHPFQGPTVEVQSPPAQPAAVAEPVAAPPPASVQPQPQPSRVEAAPPAPLPVEAPPAPRAPEPAQKSYAQIALEEADKAKTSAAAVAAAAAAAAQAMAAKSSAAAEPRPAVVETPVAAPAVAPPQTPPAPAATPVRVVGDDLTRIHSIDGSLLGRLQGLGVTSFAAIAAWTGADITRISQALGLVDRIEREGWIEQARVLAGGTSVTSPQKSQSAIAAVVDAVSRSSGGLHRIIGIDAATEKLLQANGISSLAQIAGWSTVDVLGVDSLLGAPGRVTRESWVDQAKFLTRGAEPAAAPTPSVAAPPPVPAPAPASMPAVAPPPLPEPEAAAEGAAGRAPRSEYFSSMRSVKSESLIGDAGLAPAASGAIDDLKRIRGVGVLIEKKLNALGITSYEQVANWTGADIDRISQVLDFKGRIERESWIEQARILASGGQTEFSRRADRGDV